MSADIKQLTTARDEIRRSVVELLESALADAKANQIIAIGIAVVRPHGAINTAWSDVDPVAPLLGAVTLLQARLCREPEGDGIA